MGEPGGTEDKQGSRQGASRRYQLVVVPFSCCRGTTTSSCYWCVSESCCRFYKLLSGGLVFDLREEGWKWEDVYVRAGKPSVDPTASRTATRRGKPQPKYAQCGKT